VAAPRAAATAAPTGGDGRRDRGPDGRRGGGDDGPRVPGTDRLPGVPRPPVRLPDLDDVLPGGPSTPAPPAVPAPDLRRSQDVLDFLMGP
jgi:hypothetical protein